jgi:hypothetical protein
MFYEDLHTQISINWLGPGHNSNSVYFCVAPTWRHQVHRIWPPLAVTNLPANLCLIGASVSIDVRTSLRGEEVDQYHLPLRRRQLDSVFHSWLRRLAPTVSSPQEFLLQDTSSCTRSD